MSRDDEPITRAPGVPTPQSPVPPPWTEPHLPPEAERMGLMPVTAPELAFASALRPDKRLHRVLAWLGLGAIAVAGASGLVTWLRALGVLG